MTAATMPAAFRAALEDLGAAVREARSLAALLDVYAGLLRGRRPDPDDPPLDLCPTPAAVRRALARVDEAVLRAESAWDWLPPEAREGLPSPGDLLADDESW